MPSDAGGADDALPFPAVGPVRRRVYEPNPKHGREPRGQVSAEPRNGQDALDVSVPLTPTGLGRVGIDYEERAIVVFRRHTFGLENEPRHEIFHGYVVEWHDLRQDIKNALLRAGMVNLRGKIT
jgi:hypothetical protein